MIVINLADVIFAGLLIVAALTYAGFALYDYLHNHHNHEDH